MLRSLDINKSVGPDGVSPQVLKHCASQLVGPLTRLFHMISKAAEFPTSWKVARVTPVYKNEDASLLKNYRPSPLCRLWPPYQFGFLPDTQGPWTLVSS